MKSNEVGTTLKHPETINGNVKNLSKRMKMKDKGECHFYFKNLTLPFITRVGEMEGVRASLNSPRAHAQSQKNKKKIKKKPKKLTFSGSFSGSARVGLGALRERGSGWSGARPTGAGAWGEAVRERAGAGRFGIGQGA
jgi:hypothetical protein